MSSAENLYPACKVLKCPLDNFSTCICTEKLFYNFMNTATVIFIYMFCVVYYIVCVEVLRTSQPNGVTSSAVSLPNHTFTGQA